MRAANDDRASKLKFIASENWLLIVLCAIHGAQLSSGSHQMQPSAHKDDEMKLNEA